MMKLWILVWVFLDVSQATSVFPLHFSVLGLNYKIKGSLYNDVSNSTNTPKQNDDNHSINIQDRFIQQKEVDELISKLNVSGQLPLSWSISQCRVSSLDMATLLKSTLANTSTVSSLSIRHCNCDSETFQSIRSGKRPLSSSLRALDLSFNNFDFASHHLLSSLLRRLRGLETFVYDGNKLDTSGIQSIVYSMRRHPSLSSLSLASCGIDDELMTDLVFGLKSNPNITDVNLSRNLITDEGLVCFLSALPQSPTGARIRRLDLSYCPVGDRGVLSLADACKAGKLRSLELLTLRHLDGDLSPSALTQLLQSLRNHTKLQSLDLSGNCLFPDPNAPPGSAGNPQGKKGAKKGSKLQRLMDGSLSQVTQLTQGLTESIAGGMQEMFDQATQAVQGSGSGSSKSLSSRRLLLEYDDEYNVVTPKSKTKSKPGSKPKVASKVNESSSKSTVAKKPKSSATKSGTASADGQKSKSKEELKLEAKAARRSAKSAQSTLRALVTLIKSCPQLTHLGLAGVGLSDSVVTQLATLASQMQGNTTSPVLAYVSKDSDELTMKVTAKSVSLVKARSITSSPLSNDNKHLSIAIGLDKVANTSLAQMVASFKSVLVV